MKTVLGAICASGTLFRGFDMQDLGLLIRYLGWKYLNTKWEDWIIQKSYVERIPCHLNM